MGRPPCKDGVLTEAGGEVDGCGGLYGMDAAALRTAGGVNPSATIAAISVGLIGSNSNRAL